MLRQLIALTLCHTLLAPLAAQAVTNIDFEGLDDLTSLNSQYAGAMFHNAVVLKAQFSLNEVEFPPHSGENVAVDDGAAMLIDFATPLSLISGFLTYAQPMVVTAYAGDGTTQTWNSAFSSNLGLTGDAGSAPNEGFSFASAAGIVSIQLLGDPLGFSFALDDLSITPIPEPATGWLLGAGLLVLAALRFRRKLQLAAPVLGLAAALPLNALAVGELGTLTLQPPSVPSKAATDVTVSAKVIDPKVSAGSLVLQSVDPDTGAIKAVLGKLLDDGKNGDVTPGDKIHTLKTSVNIDKPLHVRVSYGVNGMVRRLACRTLVINPEGGPMTKVSPADVQAFLNDPLNKDVKTAGQLLGSLPAEYKRHWIFMTRSESAQKGSATHPRLLVPSRDSANVFAFEIDDGSGTRSPQSIEYMSFDAVKNRFSFQSIDMTTRKLTDHNAPGDITCSSCHSGRPNWDAYDNWGGMLPYNRDRLYETSIEVKAMKKLLEDLRTDPLVSRLELPRGFSTTCDGKIEVVFPSNDPPPAARAMIPYDDAAGIKYPGPKRVGVDQGGKYLVLHHSGTDPVGQDKDEGRGSKLFDNLSDKNALHIAQGIIAHERTVVDVRPVALAIAEPCDFATLTDYAPQKAIDALLKYHGVATFPDLLKDTTAKRETLPALKANLQVKNLDGPNGVVMKGGNEAPTVDNISQEIFRRSKQGFEVDKKIGFAVDREVYDETRDGLRISLYRLFLEPSHVAVDEWSMSVMSRSGTYTFGDVFGANLGPPAGKYMQTLKARLGLQADLAGKSCAQLKALSHATFTKAINDNPGYFVRP